MVPAAAEAVAHCCSQPSVRACRPEEVYEVEAVFGRDASSVFPNMNKDDDPMEALKASIGAKRFVSETEVGCATAHGLL